MDAAHYLHVAHGATRTAPAADAFESARTEWVPLKDVPELITRQEIISSSTITALLLCIQAALPGSEPRSDPEPHGEL